MKSSLKKLGSMVRGVCLWRLILFSIMFTWTIGLHAEETHLPHFKAGKGAGKDSNKGKWEIIFVTKKSLEDGRKLDKMSKLDYHDTEDDGTSIAATGKQEKHVWAKIAKDRETVTLGGHGPVHMAQEYEYAPGLCFDPLYSGNFAIKGVLRVIKTTKNKMRFQIGKLNRHGTYEELFSTELEPGSYDLESDLKMVKPVRLKHGEILVFSAYRSAFHWYSTLTLQDFKLQKVK